MEDFLLTNVFFEAEISAMRKQLEAYIQDEVIIWESLRNYPMIKQGSFTANLLAVMNISDWNQQLCPFMRKMTGSM